MFFEGRRAFANRHVRRAFDRTGNFHDSGVWGVKAYCVQQHSRLEIVLGGVYFTRAEERSLKGPWGVKLELLAVAQAEQVHELSLADDFLVNSVLWDGEQKMNFCLYRHAVDNAPFLLIEHSLVIDPERSCFAWLQENPYS